MSAEPARGPGRDKDPARHACDRPDTAPASSGGVSRPAASVPAAAVAVPAAPAAGEVPVPPAPGPAAEVPLPFCTPDWLDDEGWAARVAACVDEEELC